ncbi:glycosyltransferase [Pontibacter diazotrophicus]|nr:glycosyltransferase [Pontibacter diazotrophicus]
MVLHLQRKFIGKTETFIANQINALPLYRHYAFTVQHIEYLHNIAEVFAPPLPQNFLDLKFLSTKNKRYFKEKLFHLNVNIIHSHFLTDASFFHPFTREVNVPKVCSCYGYDVSEFPKKFGIFSKLYLSRVFEDYDLFLAMSNDMAGELSKLGCPSEKIKIHYHGIDTQRFNIIRTYRNQAGVINLLSIGRLEPKKGHLVVLKALKKIKLEYPEINLKYTIVGEGYLMNELCYYVTRNNLSEIVEFRGHINQGEEFNKILVHANIFLLPSVTPKNGNKEGIPGTIVEAMSSGLPVISTYHAGIPHAIENGVTGFLLEEYNHEGIAECIVKLYYDEDLRQMIGQNAKRFAQKNLDLNTKATELERTYLNLIKSYNLSEV